MIVRTLQEAEKGERRVDSEGWNSVRLLLKNDDMGFSFHITTIYEGAELPLHGKEVHNAEGAYELDAEAVTDK